MRTEDLYTSRELRAGNLIATALWVFSFAVLAALLAWSVTG